LHSYLLGIFRELSFVFCTVVCLEFPRIILRNLHSYLLGIFQELSFVICTVVCLEFPQISLRNLLNCEQFKPWTGHWGCRRLRLLEFIDYRQMKVARQTFLIMKPTRCTNFSNLFLNKTLHVSDSPSVHHQEFSTVHTAIHTGLLTAFEPTRKLSTILYDIHHCCVYSEKLLMMDRGTVRNM